VADDPATRLVAEACAAIEAAETAPGTGSLARTLGVPAGRLQKAFRSVLGVSPQAYTAARRDQRFRRALRDEPSVTEAVYAAGFEAPSRAYEKSGARFGMTPGDYAAGGAGTEISYAIADSPLGRMLVGVTPRGLCTVQFSNSDEMLVAELRREFPGADIRAGGHELRGVVDQVAATLREGTPPASLALDIRATAFQRRVWDALQAIPPGETRTYGEIAHAIGAPRAARAVGTACSQNRLAVVIPCHRAVRGDGGLGGYRWGLERKERLLAQEGAHPSRRRR
jgi:AraC family transcriptional regulator of adaptative response/methylated-DNA-[protein]-cysteine methyltransferase